MNDAKKSMEPWQLILILVLLLAFFGGLYVTNQTMVTKLDSVEAGVLGAKETLKTKLDGIENRLDAMKAKSGAKPAPAPVAPAPVAAAPVPPKPAE